VKRCFLFTVGSVCRLMRFTTGSRNSVKDVRKSQMMPDQARKWLRRQPVDFCATDFDAPVKRLASVSILVEDMSRNNFFFFQIRISHVLHFMFICDLFTDFPSYIASTWW
jgi:hypothetical protein